MQQHKDYITDYYITPQQISSVAPYYAITVKYKYILNIITVLLLSPACKLHIIFTSSTVFHVLILQTAQNPEKDK
jgi:hypothetical protein